MEYKSVLTLTIKTMTDNLTKLPTAILCKQHTTTDNNLQLQAAATAVCFFFYFFVESATSFQKKLQSVR